MMTQFALGQALSGRSGHRLGNAALAQPFDAVRGSCFQGRALGYFDLIDVVGVLNKSGDVGLMAEIFFKPAMKAINVHADDLEEDPIVNSSIEFLRGLSPRFVSEPFRVQEQTVHIPNNRIELHVLLLKKNVLNSN